MATPSIAPRSAQSGLFNQSLSVRVNLRVSGGICKASWRLAVQPCLPNGVAYSRQRATRCFAHSLGPWHHGSGRRVAPNNSFKPNLLRYGKSVAEKACHAFVSTTQVGLTQALGVLQHTGLPIGVAVIQAVAHGASWSLAAGRLWSGVGLLRTRSCLCAPGEGVAVAFGRVGSGCRRARFVAGLRPALGVGS